MQNKNRKNLYKILFITILLGFTISLVGCNWLSLGLLNVFDPQAQIRVSYSEIDLTEGQGTINFEVSTINEVEFIGEGFSYKYYNNGVLISDLSKTVGKTFYVAPLGSIEITNMPLYYQEVMDYVKMNPMITELTCTISLFGTDGAGHSITKSVTFDLPALQPGIDFEPPTAVITVTPGTTGTAPFTVVLDASASFDNRGIASYAWDFGDETTGTGITESHTYDIPGLYFVTLTVTDFYGNEGYDTVTIIANEPEAPTAVITTVPDPAEGNAPLTIYFDAYESESEAEIISYAWDFGDGSSGIGITINHTYSNIGTYTVILTVTDSNGKKGYDSVNIKVKKELTVVINTTPDPPTGTAPFTVYFDAYGSDSESGIVSYAWDFGDGSTGGIGITTNHTYSTVGTYTVILIITDSNGYEAYDSVDVTVEECECPE